MYNKYPHMRAGISKKIKNNIENDKNKKNK